MPGVRRVGGHLPEETIPAVVDSWRPRHHGYSYSTSEPNGVTRSNTTKSQRASCVRRIVIKQYPTLSSSLYVEHIQGIHTRINRVRVPRIRRLLCRCKPAVGTCSVNGATGTVKSAFGPQASAQHNRLVVITASFLTYCLCSFAPHGVNIA